MDDPGFAAATRSYAAWLATCMPLWQAGLDLKAEKMGKSRFAFLRATFYRWRWQFAAVDATVRNAPRVLSAGDAHLENFATWRDAEGRLAWGISDFDEATHLPFTSDLVRLATSIVLERRDSAERLRLAPDAAIEVLLDGYREGLRDGTPFILEEGHEDLRRAAEDGYDPVRDWEKIRARGRKEPEPPPELRDLLVASLPRSAETVSVRAVDDKGLGSLGRPRWFLVAQWRGGPLAREAKAAAPSAWRMDEADRPDPIAEHRQALLLARRAPDPSLRVAKRGDTAWVVRSLSPEARKIDLEMDRAAGSQDVLLRAMGAEIANLHAGAAGSPHALRNALDKLDRKKPSWLLQAAKDAAGRVEHDRKQFEENRAVVTELRRPPRVTPRDGAPVAKPVLTPRSPSARGRKAGPTNG